METAPKYSLTFHDGAKALILAVITSILTGIYGLLTTGELITWPAIQKILMASATVMVGYILKNFLTTSDDRFLGKETGAAPVVTKDKP